MMRAFASELLKLRRPGMLLGGVGTIAGLAALITILLWATATESVDPTALRRGLPLALLAGPTGLLPAFSYAPSLVGVVALVLFAQSLGAEYGQGTLKVLLSREPRRLAILAGKLTALAVLMVVATLAATLVQLGAATAMAAGRGVDLGLLYDDVPGSLALVARVWAGALAWGFMGTALAALFRSAPPAIGVGIGYTLVGEGLVSLALPDVGRYLPGQAIAAFVAGGVRAPDSPITPLSTELALVLMATYAAVFLVASGLLLAKRDVAA